MEFSGFMGLFQEAVRRKDMEFLGKAYGDWFSSSDIGQKGGLDGFLKAAFNDLEPIGRSRFERSECFGDFCIATMTGPDGSPFSLTFRKRGDSWIFFNERSGLGAFKKIYAFSYSVSGSGRLGILFNGSPSPILRDIGSSGFVSLINAALKKGDNELKVLPLGKGDVEVSIAISSARAGEIIDTAQGDVLSWRGIVKEPVVLKFTAE
ncbi:MAG: hypothetical protein U0R44_05285 [Candidatus Micrarchaeia archaeon]